MAAKVVVGANSLSQYAPSSKFTRNCHAETISIRCNHWGSRFFSSRRKYPISKAGAVESSAEKKGTALGSKSPAVGKLKQPTGRDRQWMFVCLPIASDDPNDGTASVPEFPDLSIDTESFAHFKQTRKFRDRTAVIKKNRGVGSISRRHTDE